MEHTGVTPSGAVVAPDLAALLQQPGPYVTVFLTTEADIDNASYRSEQHWKDVRRDLGEAGAPQEALAAIDPLVPDAHHQGQTLGVVASASGLLHVEHGPHVPPQDQGEFGPLPLLIPFISWRQAFPTASTPPRDRWRRSRCEPPSAPVRACGSSPKATCPRAGSAPSSAGRDSRVSPQHATCTSR